MPNNYRKGLHAPSIPVAEFDGLIKIADLDRDVIVHFPVWNEAEPNDTYQLLLNGALVGPVMSIPDPAPEPGLQLSLMIPVNTHLLNDATYTVSYRASSTIGQVSADSAPKHIRIDRTPPGAALLAALSFPDVTLGETLIGFVSGYAGMATDDVIQTLCNGIEGPNVTVLAEHLTTTPISIRFERSFLQTLGSDEVFIAYRVTDRAGNTSNMSQLVNLTLQV